MTSGKSDKNDSAASEKGDNSDTSDSSTEEDDEVKILSNLIPCVMLLQVSVIDICCTDCQIINSFSQVYEIIEK